MTDQLLKSCEVSRETLDRLQIFVDLTLKWTKAINLIAPSTSEQIWTRHIKDSAQLFEIAPGNWNTWTDLGSGGGFPGLVIAILSDPSRTVTLIESDKRKCQFLNTVRRELDLNVNVREGRIEDVDVAPADVLSARALSGLPNLLHHADRFLDQSGIALFPKGQNYQSELNEATKDWEFNEVLHTSRTHSAGRILEISGIKRRER